MPKISVITSVYNGEQYLKEAIECILAQSHEDFEFIVVNDGSTDRTGEILSQYLQKDSRVKIIQNDENIGLTQSLNRAIDAASGDFIARHDADDISFTDRLKKQHSIAIQTGADIIGCQAYTYENNVFKIRPRTEFLENISLSKLKFGNIFVHGTLIFKSQVLKTCKYDESFRYAQDYELMLRLMKDNKKVHMVNEVLYFSRSSEQSTTRSKRSEQLECASQICKKHFGTSFYHADGKNYFLKVMLLCIRKLIGN